MAATALEGCSSSSPLPTLPLCLGVFFGLLLHGSPQPVMGFRPVTELGAGWCLTICDDDFCLEGRQTSAPAEDMMAIPEWPVLCTACWCFSILLKLLASREAAGTLPPATHTMWAQAVAALQYYTHTHRSAPSGGRAQLWPGMAARELTRYPVAGFRMINTSLVGGAVATPDDYMALCANLELPGLLWDLLWLCAIDDVTQDIFGLRLLRTRAAATARLMADLFRNWVLGPVCSEQVSFGVCLLDDLHFLAWLPRRLRAAPLPVLYRRCLFALECSSACYYTVRLSLWWVFGLSLNWVRDGAWPSVMMIFALRGGKLLLRLKTWWRFLSGMYCVQHVGASAFCWSYWLAAKRPERCLQPLTPCGPRLWQHCNITHTHTDQPLQRLCALPPGVFLGGRGTSCWCSEKCTR